MLDTEVHSKFFYECHAKKNMDTASDEFLDWWEERQVIAARTTMGHQGIWRRRSKADVAVVYRKVQAPVHGGSC